MSDSTHKGCQRCFAGLNDTRTILIEVLLK